MLNPEDERETNVTMEDQKKINRFSQLLNERIEVESFMRGRKELLKLYEDASDELVLADDDEKVQYAVGDAFLSACKEDVENHIEINKAELEEEIVNAQSKIENKQSEMAELKTVLYAKFGNTINLEES
eukprot:Plantae.Rhodophyta-Purpureofilum_apyrenoidigerum.ctg16088.p1 GENE.Plantae.Rhodophyta-Purpureofilum_apyrenoidigerum.ctg16088~~Plantae.Rhodophyta-Purpureofilum_apyrenoidigerum.ctg16088.p1  ORF type:complete len:129 (+),score=48.95 Plantae.Rhodophyta-Purpureofilum_apyrenoidigerum.ctg16088:216-602(+)